MIGRPDVLKAAEEHVARGRAQSANAGVGAAKKARRDELAGLLAEMRAESGPVSEEEESWARGVLGL